MCETTGCSRLLICFGVERGHDAVFSEPARGEIGRSTAARKGAGPTSRRTRSATREVISKPPLHSDFEMGWYVGTVRYRTASESVRTVRRKRGSPEGEPKSGLLD